MAINKNDSFWISFADLMTSLFFVMLVLFIVVVGKMAATGQGVDMHSIQEEIKRLRQENKELKAQNKQLEGEKKASEEELKKLVELFNVQEKIDKHYFTYDTKFQRFTLKNFSSRFKTNSYNITDIPTDERQKLLDIGKSLKKTFEQAQKDKTTKNAQYLLIVEGQASKDGYQGNDVLSYSRALSLVKYWKNNGIKLPTNCEILISGSGQSSRFRDQPDIPPYNQRFVIHIIPKPGKMPKVNK